MPKKGYKQTPEHIKNVKLACSGNNGWTGKHHKPETIEKMKGRIPWNANLTKENNASLKAMSISMKKTAQQRNGSFKKGHKSWSKGLNKFNNPSLMSMSIKVSGAGNSHWQGGREPEIRKRIVTREWKDLRKKIYARDNWTCMICGKHCSTGIQCHHLIPYRLTQNDSEDNLITLCVKDHATLEAYTNKILKLNLFGNYADIKNNLDSWMNKMGMKI